MVWRKSLGLKVGRMANARIWPGVHILHHHRSVHGAGALHGVIQRLLGHELDVLVDGELQGSVPARDRAQLEPSTLRRASMAVNIRPETPCNRGSNFSSRPPSPMSSVPT